MRRRGEDEKVKGSPATWRPALAFQHRHSGRIVPPGFASLLRLLNAVAGEGRGARGGPFRSCSPREHLIRGSALVVARGRSWKDRSRARDVVPKNGRRESGTRI